MKTSFQDMLGCPNHNDSLFDPLLYLRDIEEYLRDNPLDPIINDVEDFTKDALAEMPGMEWLNFVNCTLVAPISSDLKDQENQLIEFVQKLKSECTYLEQSFNPAIFPEGFKEPMIALDTETTGLDTRCLYDYQGDLILKTKMVGFSIASSDTEGYYFPVLHTGTDGVINWDMSLVRLFLDAIHNEFFVVYHNAPFDREIIALNGGSCFRRWPYFADTQVLDFFYDVNNKSHGLKHLSEKHLGRKMIEINQLFDLGSTSKKGMNINFDRISAKTAYVYGASDSINTFGLLKFYMSQEPNKNAFLSEHIPLTIDHKASDVLRNLQRGGAPVNFDYFLYAAKDTEYRIHLLEQETYKYVGEKFDINSPDQVSNILFSKYQIPILPGEERNKKNNYSTKEEVLDKLFELYPEYTILRYIVTYRKLVGTNTKFFIKSVVNSYVDALQPYTKVQIQYSQTIAQTGRFSSASNKGKSKVFVNESNTGKLSYSYFHGSWDCSFNSQGITNPHYIVKRARKIKRIDPASGIDPDNPYPEEIIQKFIKRVATNK